MSEYTNVERPFLEKLRQIGWTVIDKGACGIPQDPAILCVDAKIVAEEKIVEKYREVEGTKNEITNQIRII